MTTRTRTRRLTPEEDYQSALRAKESVAATGSKRPLTGKELALQAALFRLAELTTDYPDVRLNGTRVRALLDAADMPYTWHRRTANRDARAQITSAAYITCGDGYVMVQCTAEAPGGRERMQDVRDATEFFNCLAAIL